MKTPRSPLSFALTSCLALLSIDLYAAGTALPGKSGGAALSPVRVQGWANSIGALFASSSPDLTALAPVLVSLAGVDYDDPKTREALAPLYATVQTQARTLLATPAAAQPGSADPALAAKYLALDMLGNLHPQTKARAEELSRAYQDALPAANRAKLQANQDKLIKMASALRTWGIPSSDYMKVGEFRRLQIDSRSIALTMPNSMPPNTTPALPTISLVDRLPDSTQAPRRRARLSPFTGPKDAAVALSEQRARDEKFAAMLRATPAPSAPQAAPEAPTEKPSAKPRRSFLSRWLDLEPGYFKRNPYP
jgi:hypothetical protein